MSGASQRIAPCIRQARKGDPTYPSAPQHVVKTTDRAAVRVMQCRIEAHVITCSSSPRRSLRCRLRSCSLLRMRHSTCNVALQTAAVRQTAMTAPKRVISRNITTPVFFELRGMHAVFGVRVLGCSQQGAVHHGRQFDAGTDA